MGIDFDAIMKQHNSQIDAELNKEQAVEEPVRPSEELESLRERPVHTESEQVYAPSNELRPQTGGNASSVQTKQSASKPSRRVVPDYVQMRNFPRCVVDIAQQEFPTANSRADALAAYVIVKSGASMEGMAISPDVKTLVKSYQGDRTLATTAERLDTIERQLSILAGVFRELELTTGYLLFDRLGFRKESTMKGPRGVNMLEEGVMDMVDRMRESVGQMRKEDQRRHGRPERGKGKE